MKKLIFDMPDVAMRCGLGRSREKLLPKANETA